MYSFLSVYFRLSFSCCYCVRFSFVCFSLYRSVLTRFDYYFVLSIHQFCDDLSGHFSINLHLSFNRFFLCMSVLFGVYFNGCQYYFVQVFNLRWKEPKHSPWKIGAAVEEWPIVDLTTVGMVLLRQPLWTAHSPIGFRMPVRYWTKW